MKDTTLDRIAKAWAGRASRRRLLTGLGGGALFGASALEQRRRAVSGQTEVVLAGTPEATLGTEFLLPTPDPVPLGDNLFLINGQVTYIEPEAAVELSGTPTASITMQGEMVFVNTDVILANVSFPGSPESGTPEPTPAGTPAADVLEKVCGLKNSENVETYKGDLGVSKEYVAARERPVGNLRWNSEVQLEDRYDDPGNVASWRWCSGTLIDTDLFLTAGHCFVRESSDFRLPLANGTNDVISEAEIATNMNVNFGYQLSAKGKDQFGESFPVLKLVENGYPSGFDYAILQLDGRPGDTYEITPVAAALVSVGSTLCIIGHPMGTPKRISAGNLLEELEPQIVYDIDTSSGSSGSGVLLGPDGPIVGVHTTGNCRDDDQRLNKGVLISNLLPVSDTLRRLAKQNESAAAPR